MKKLRYAVIFVLIILTVVSFAACSERKITEVTLASNSFPTEYKVDAPLDLTGAFVVLRYSDDNVERKEITVDMVEGFDTATTGEKTLTVKYGDFSVSHTYRVYNPENAAKEIITTARLTLSAYESGEYIEYTLRLNMGDLESISAISFTLQSETNLGIGAAKTNLTVSSEGLNASYGNSLSDDGTTLKTVIFETDGQTLMRETGVIAKIRINGGNNRAVTVKDVVLSDGSRNYYLPSA